VDSADVDPIPISLFLEYADWFREQAGVEVEPDLVEDLAKPNGRFEATLRSGRRVAADAVVAAPGISRFGVVPEWVERSLSPERWSHTCELVHFEELRGKRVLIVGGRQSAFEWAALIHEAGATEVHVVHRHASPAFAEADWTWVNSLVDAMVADPGWFRSLPPDRRQAVSLRLWGEGRLKVEPWLEGRVNRDGITVWPDSRIEACVELPGGALAVTLDAGACLTIDHVIFATGYKVDMARIPLLDNGNILADLETRNGFPVLSERFESSVESLFITSMAAGQDFGPFFGFTVAARTSAKIIGAALFQGCAGIRHRLPRRGS